MTPPAKARLVVIDDDDKVLKALAMVLRSQFDVKTYSDPVGGALAGARPDVDLVLLDIQMPGHDGFWVFEQIRARNSMVPIVFNSAYHEDMATGEKLAKCDHQGLIQKGTSMSTFIERIQAVLGGDPM